MRKFISPPCSIIVPVLHIEQWLLKRYHAKYVLGECEKPDKLKVNEKKRPKKWREKKGKLIVVDVYCKSHTQSTFESIFPSRKCITSLSFLFLLLLLLLFFFFLYVFWCALSYFPRRKYHFDRIRASESKTSARVSSTYNSLYAQKWWPCKSQAPSYQRVYLYSLVCTFPFQCIHIFSPPSNDSFFFFIGIWQSKLCLLFFRHFFLVSTACLSRLLLLVFSTNFLTFVHRFWF